MLESTVDEAVVFLDAFADSKPAQRAVAALRLLREVGLGYLQLGQPINTLSGGESQRLKLVRHLAEATIQNSKAGVRTPNSGADASSHADRARVSGGRSGSNRRRSDFKGSLFLLDEPTTGLHFDDVRVLLNALQRLVDAGHSLVVIEHNVDVLKCADWIIDLGPEAGDKGGQLVAAGTPEGVAACNASHTGRFLRAALNHRIRGRPKAASSAKRPASSKSAGGNRQ